MYCINNRYDYQVVAIFGIVGACRRVELYNLCINNVKEEGSVLIVNIKATKNDKPEIFTIASSEEFNYVEVCTKYISLRHLHVKQKKLFCFTIMANADAIQLVSIHLRKYQKILQIF